MITVMVTTALIETQLTTGAILEWTQVVEGLPPGAKLLHCYMKDIDTLALEFFDPIDRPNWILNILLETKRGPQP